MVNFYIRAETGKAVGRSPEQVDEDYRQAAAMANLVVPYRHSRLSAVKLAGDDPNSPVRFKDDATADELRAELMKRLEILTSAGLIDLQALPVPDGETVRQVRRAERSRTSAGTFWHRDEQRVALIAPVPTHLGTNWHSLSSIAFEFGDGAPGKRRNQPPYAIEKPRCC